MAAAAWAEKLTLSSLSAGVLTALPAGRKTGTTGGSSALAGKVANTCRALAAGSAAGALSNAAKRLPGASSMLLSMERPVAPTAERASAATADAVATTGSCAGALRRVTAAMMASAALRGLAGAGGAGRVASSACCTAVSS